MKKFKNFMSGKGYYIALILCAVAIGISGYLYYRNADSNPLEETVPVVGTEPILATNPVEATQPVAATEAILGGEETPLPQTTLPVVTKPMQTAAPLEGQTVAVFAMDHLDYNPTTRDWRVHNGMDIAAEAGTPVCAAADGTVYSVFEDETMGTTVVIRHQNGYVTCYASLAKEVTVKTGDAVTMGQQIGTVGDTALLESAIGEHVHFSVTCNDEPMDPAEFLGLE